MPISRIHWWCGVSSPEIRPLQLTETDIVGWFELIPAVGLKTLLCIRAQGFSQLRTSIQEVGSKCQNGLCTFCPRNPSPQGPRDLATPRLEGAVLTVWCQTKRFQILPSPLGGCVTLGESLNFSETLQFPPAQYVLNAMAGIQYHTVEASVTGRHTSAHKKLLGWGRGGELFSSRTYCSLCVEVSLLRSSHISLPHLP